jgi:polar amino acid transport system substrate-binding protein
MNYYAQDYIDYNMLQVIQHQKSGDILVEDLPAPLCPENGILVQNYFSLISAGTEKFSVEKAKSSLIERARKQPEDVKMVIDFVKKEGIAKTAKRVLNALDSYKLLGYSSAGVVLESTCDEFKPGDRVACGGAGYANHAEVVAVPKNLAVHLPDNISFEEASFTTLGAIAMQGFRQADPRLGETVAVVGLGLLGQITVQLLRAAGCRVVGLDINEDLFEAAKKYGCEATFLSTKANAANVKAFARGLGCDSVILTASTSSNEPMELALDICRKRGSIVVVGAVGMDIPRGPFYLKEIDLKIACSYGPGRYDTDYEVKGNDYPAAYVRWTENRNMISFVDLISSKSIDVKSMITHTFKVADSAKAYDIIMGKTPEKFTGIVIEYPERKNILSRTVANTKFNSPTDSIKVAMLGAGSFATNNLIPALKTAKVEMAAVTTATSVNASTAAKLHGFKVASTDSLEIIRSKDNNVIFCASRHDSHAEYVLESIKAGKPIFIEKPLCVTKEELESIKDAHKQHSGQVMVGFNRRFSKPFRDISNFFEGREEPLSMIYRVNAGNIPKTHWVHDSANRGRIIGEVCHFIDTMMYLCGERPQRIYAECISVKSEDVTNADNVSINIKFSGGSIGTVHYFSNGDKSVPKEYCEVYSQRQTAFMDNFTSVELFQSGRQKTKKYDGSKGIDIEVRETIEAIRNGKNMPISFQELYDVTAATFAVLDSLAQASPIDLNK